MTPLFDIDERDPKDLCDALDASGVVGTWDWNPVTNLCCLDRRVADLLTGDESLAGQKIDRLAATAAVHPEDAAWLKVEFARLAKEGGVYVAEYRVIRPSGQIRWVLSRGRIYRDSIGRAIRGRGILMDITDNREPGCGFVVRLDPRSDEPIDRAAAHAIAAVRALGNEGSPMLRALSKALLREFGHEIARRLRP